jgi:hypothetical protein
MKLILRQLLWLTSALVALYGLVLAITLVLMPPGDAGPALDTTRASASLFLTEPKYVFMTRSRLNTPTDKVLVVGASNVGVGFRQAQVQALMPQVEVHNLSIGGSNATQVRQVIDLVREVQSPESRRHNTVVIGLWYGLFADDRARWHTPDRHAGDTDIDIERYRYGFYRRTAAGAEAVLPPERLNLGVTLIHPYLVLDRLARDTTRSLRRLMNDKPKAMTDEQRNAVVLAEEEKRKYLAFWNDYMGGATTLTEGPYRQIEQAVDTVLADGGKVVLVDMPIPPWHAAGSPLHADYLARTDQLVRKLTARPGVSLIRMTQAGADDDFSDEVHPKPRVAPLWAARLAAGLTQTPTLAAQTATALNSPNSNDPEGTTP